MPRIFQPLPETVSAGVAAAALMANIFGASAATMRLPAGNSESRVDCTRIGLSAGQRAASTKPLSALVGKAAPAWTSTVSPHRAELVLAWKSSPALMLIV